MLFTSIVTYAAPQTPIDGIKDSKQLLLVIAPTWNDPVASLQRYQRDKNNQWTKVGEPIPVFVGKKGMAWGTPFQPNSNDPIKHEGDGKAPAGVFNIGDEFGFGPQKNKHMAYLQLTDTSFCADDINSTHYNQVIDISTVRPDWGPNTGELMGPHHQPLYEKGALVQYNSTGIVDKKLGGRGSCIFIHIWRHPPSEISTENGTAGCVAMEKANLEEVLNWLNSKKKPLIALFPQDPYNSVKKQWDLPI